MATEVGLADEQLSGRKGDGLSVAEVLVGVAAVVLLIAVWRRLAASVQELEGGANRLGILHDREANAHAAPRLAALVQEAPWQQVAVAVLVGSPIGGQLISADKGSFVDLQIFSGVMMAAGCVPFIVLRMLLAEWKLMVKI